MSDDDSFVLIVDVPMLHRIPATPVDQARAAAAAARAGAGAAAASADGAPNTEASTARVLAVCDSAQLPTPKAPPKASPMRRARRSPSSALSSQNSTPSSYSEIRDSSDSDFVESSSDDDSSSARRPLGPRRMAQPKPAAKLAAAAAAAPAAGDVPAVDGAAAPPGDDDPLAPAPAPKAAPKPAPKARVLRANPTVAQRLKSARNTAARTNFDLTNQAQFLRLAFATAPANSAGHTCGSVIPAGRALHAFVNTKRDFGWRTVLSCKAAIVRLSTGNVGMSQVDEADGTIWLVPGHWVRVEMSAAEIAAARGAAATPAAH